MPLRHGRRAAVAAKRSLTPTAVQNFQLRFFIPDQLLIAAFSLRGYIDHADFRGSSILFLCHVSLISAFSFSSFSTHLPFFFIHSSSSPSGFSTSTGKKRAPSRYPHLTSRHLQLNEHSRSSKLVRVGVPPATLRRRSHRLRTPNEMLRYQEG